MLTYCLAAINNEQILGIKVKSNQFNEYFFELADYGYIKEMIFDVDGVIIVINDQLSYNCKNKI